MFDGLGNEVPGDGEHRRSQPSPDGGPDGFVVVVADPETGDIDAFGPYGESDARAEAIRRREELDLEHLGDVVVVVVALTPPR